MSDHVAFSSGCYNNTFLLMRHGHSEANQQGRIVSSPSLGVGSFGLSSRGREEVGKALTAWRWAKPARVVHSDFLRTTQTAAWVAEHFGVVSTSDVGLRERGFGELEGCADARYEEAWAWDATDASHQQFGVESVDTVAERMVAVLRGLESRHDGEVVLLVSHGDPLQILLTALAGVDARCHRDRPPLQPAEVVALP